MYKHTKYHKFLILALVITWVGQTYNWEVGNYAIAQEPTLVINHLKDLLVINDEKAEMFGFRNIPCAKISTGTQNTNKKMTNIIYM